MGNLYVSPPDELFDKVLTEHWNKLHTSLEDATIIHFIDTGGQPEFQEILPALLSGSCISMLLFKLHEELKQRYQVEYVSRDGTKSESYMTSYTSRMFYSRVFQQWPAYRSETAKPDPTHSGSAALVVGTHSDLATEYKLIAAENSLKKKVENAQYT